MKNRTLALPLLVVTAVVALVLGSFGTATAAGLTSHTVKKIAGKVVDKKAKTLSVAHADTATNATLLNGQPASAYQGATYQYLLPIQPVAASRNYTFPGLPAGNYVASYSLLMANGTATKHDCEFLVGPNREGFTYSVPGYSAGFSTIGATTYVSSTGAAPTLLCEAAGSTWSLSGGGVNAQNRVVFTRVDQVTNGGGVGAKSDSSSAPGSASAG